MAAGSLGDRGALVALGPSIGVLHGPGGSFKPYRLCVCLSPSFRMIYWPAAGPGHVRLGSHGRSDRTSRGSGERAMSEVTVRVPAKVNLLLAVGPLRDDGFHDLVNVFHAVSLFDELT